MSEHKTVIFTLSASGTGREIPLLPTPPRRMQKYPYAGKFGFTYQSAMWREYERQRIEALVKRAFGPTPAAGTHNLKNNPTP